MDTFKAYLDSLLYKMVSIYIASFSDKPIVFSGILVSYDHDLLRLVLKNAQEKNTPHIINFNRHFQTSESANTIGSIVEIPFDKIDAILHHPGAIHQ